ncbi:hypothetical protein LSCM1_01277 [Leishmania martiniquensis]|uniref:G domain-containing protein n=1 Tax=Leishmania martiniquensis TaxID=1580590 RepID=A0A836GXS6_9TRYP|nr:hypothetical protein LSCM1_01277 [Leishmania martiniquensis]
MPIWSRSTITPTAVELRSEDEDVSSSSNESDHSSSGTSSSRSIPCRAIAQEQTSASLRFAQPWRIPEEGPSSAPATSLHSNRFTAGAVRYAITAPVIRPLLMGASSPAVSVHSARERWQSAQEHRVRSGRDSLRSAPRSLSARSSRSGSFAFPQPVLDQSNTMNLLVLGAPQVGKSLFINQYRAAITNTTRWPAAPVGIAGFYGTTTVEPFPNHARLPTWLCIDTPGCLYTEKNEVLLEKLTEGIPWKTKLRGPNALTLSQVKSLFPITANKAHQCIIVVPATDLIKGEGWANWLLRRQRYRPSDGAADTVLYLKNLTSSLRALMNDVSPFVVVTKMDRFGGAGSRAACAALISILGQCVPVNRVYFTAAVEGRAPQGPGRTMVLESSTKQNLVRLHEDICLTVQWRNQMDAA